MTTPTPRTDAATAMATVPFEKAEVILVTECVPADFARQLERGLAAAQSEITVRDGALRIAVEQEASLRRDLAAAQEENAKLREACAAGWGEPALINTLRAELASVKAERDALKERIWQIRVELGALFTMLPNEVPGLAMEVCERDADRQCLFRAFELAAHKEGA